MVIFIKVLHGQDIYKSIEEKGANFLYLIVKNHVFADGNKRIAATLFIYFLNFYGILYKNEKKVIDNNTLTALTLLYEYIPDSVIIRDKNDLKSKLQQGLDDIKLNKTYSSDEVFQKLDNL